MPIKTNHLPLARVEVKEHGTPEFMREHFLNQLREHLRAEGANLTTCRLLEEALLKWSPVSGVPKTFRDYAERKRAIRSQLDADEGRVRKLLERSVQSQVGDDPAQLRQDRVDARVETAALFVNELAIGLHLAGESPVF